MTPEEVWPAAPFEQVICRATAHGVAALISIYPIGALVTEQLVEVRAAEKAIGPRSSSKEVASHASRRVSIVAGFYRTCVIDGLLEHSPADHVRRPRVSNESPILGLTHLQFEAILAAARDSSRECDFALVAMLGLLGLRIFEATGADINDLGEEHGHRVLMVRGKGDKHVLTPLPPAVARAIERATDNRDRGPVLLNRRSHRMDRHGAARRLRHLALTAGVTTSRIHPHMLRHTYVTTMLDAGVDLRDVQIAARHADPRTTMRYDRARKNLDRHPNYILAAYMAAGT